MYILAHIIRDSVYLVTKVFSNLTLFRLVQYMFTNIVNYCAASILRLEETSVLTVSTVSTYSV